MGVWSALSTTYRLARDLDDARDAAAAVLDAGGSPLAALRAFAATSDNQLDDAAVAALEDGLRGALAVAGRVVDAAAWVAEHADAVRTGVDTTLGVVINLGWRASAWRATLRRWSEA